MARKKKGMLFGKPRDDVVKHPGAFSSKAKKASESTAEYSKDVLKSDSKASPATKKQAVLAKAFATMRAKKIKKK